MTSRGRHPAYASDPGAVGVQDLLRAARVAVLERDEELGDDVGELGDPPVELALLLDLGLEGRETAVDVGALAQAR